MFKSCTNPACLEINPQPIENFHKSGYYKSNGEPKYSTRCKKCTSIRLKNWNINNPETKLAYARRPQSKFSQAQSSAKVRDIIWELTYEQWWSLVERNRCHYCSRKLGETGSSLDRIDSAAGYILGNCVPCCYACNVIKGGYITHDEMKTLMKNRKKNGIDNFPRPPKKIGRRKNTIQDLE